jgi:ubiquitin carboxyl-terminal hydrolase 8
VFALVFKAPSWTSAINMTNPLGSKGNLAIAFSMVLRELGKPDNTYIVPKNFRV